MIFPEAQQNDTQNTLTHEKKLGKNFLQNFWQIYRRYLRSYLILITHYTNDDRKTMAHTRVENRGVQTVR